MNLLSNPKIMLYSHDSWGLGHLRRTLALASSFAGELPNASILLASGSPCATQFPLDDGIDLIKLPCVTKNSEGRYAARQLRHGYQSVIDMRKALLQSAYLSFMPDIVIVDHQVVGLAEEMLPVLKLAKQNGTYCI